MPAAASKATETARAERPLSNNANRIVRSSAQLAPVEGNAQPDARVNAPDCVTLADAPSYCDAAAAAAQTPRDATTESRAHTHAPPSATAPPRCRSRRNVAPGAALSAQGASARRSHQIVGKHRNDDVVESLRRTARAVVGNSAQASNSAPRHCGVVLRCKTTVSAHKRRAPPTDDVGRTSIRFKVVERREGVWIERHGVALDQRRSQQLTEDDARIRQARRRCRTRRRQRARPPIVGTALLPARASARIEVEQLGRRRLQRESVTRPPCNLAARDTCAPRTASNDQSRAHSSAANVGVKQKSARRVADARRRVLCALRCRPERRSESATATSAPATAAKRAHPPMADKVRADVHLSARGATAT